MFAACCPAKSGIYFQLFLRYLLSSPSISGESRFCQISKVCYFKKSLVALATSTVHVPQPWPLSDKQVSLCGLLRKLFIKGSFLLEPSSTHSVLCFPPYFSPCKENRYLVSKGLSCDHEDESHSLRRSLQKGHSDPGLPRGSHTYMHQPWICYFRLPVT